MTARWVVGRGLLGRAVVDAAPGGTFTADVRWHDPDDALVDLATAAARFAGSVGPGDSWEIVWSAGRGVTSTSADELAVEVDVFGRFLDQVVGRSDLDPSHGALFLASSVGGVYGGATEPPFSEHTPPRASSAYGEAKLAMEDLARDAVARTGLRALVGRITNLYGPAQDLSKGQGLLSTIVASHLTARPATIYVSLDTLRDYLYADDCGAMVLAGLERLRREPPGSFVVKILASSMPWSIGAILSEAARIHRLRAPIVSGQGPQTARGQAPDLRVRSVVWPEIDALARTTLPEGLLQLHRAQLREVMLPAAPAR